MSENPAQIVAAPADTIVLPAGINGKPIILVLKETKIAVEALPAVRQANPLNFADMITTFSTALHELTDAITQIKTALVRIDHRLEYMHADLLINHVPVLAKQRGLKPTVAEAEALIILDPDYSEMSLMRAELFDTVEGLLAKHKAINTAYYDTKDVARLRFGGGYQFNEDPGIPEDGRMGTIRRRNQFRSEG